MQINIETLSTLAEYRALAPAWNALVAETPQGLAGLDATNTCEWFEAIIAAFPEAAESRVLVARRGGEVVGILPLVLQRRHGFGLHLLMASELYGGRNAPLLNEYDGAIWAALIGELDRACPGWINLQMTLPDAHAGAQAIVSAFIARGHHPERGADMESPYFPLTASAEQFKAGVSKSVLQMMRTSRNKFGKIGPLSLRSYTQPQEAAELIELVLAIERQSWKHAAGTAITTQPRQEAFYRALFPLAMDRGLLHAEVLRLGDEPVAYNFGLLRQQVFCCLKHSNVEAYDKLSPSYLVNESLFDKLRTGGVQSFDFMGLPDPHKLRWSDHNGIYTRRSWLFFNRSLKARLAAFTYRHKQMFAAWRARRASPLS